MANINVGDVVRLKSGGPFMTVTDVNFDGKLFCHWFESGKQFDGLFPSVALHSKAEADAIDAEAAAW